MKESNQDILIPEIIRKKRDGLELTTEEIRYFISGVTTEVVTDAQIAAFAMAAIFQDLDSRERTDLTLAMRDSGEVLQWREWGLDGPIMDKHSTGGVGDTVSFLLAPILAACGGFVPMIAGRGLAHTGGTIDKLESIPGYNTAPDVEHFQRVVRQYGFAIAGQTANFAPADRRMYATRDVTATVEQYGLITASILSKKLAAGLGSLVMDIKVGNGAFMRDLSSARALAQSLCTVGTHAGMPTIALLTDMNEPLANSAGNALEVKEALDLLSRRKSGSRLEQLTLDLAAENLVLSGICDDIVLARKQAQAALDSGEAAARFERSIHAMGGPSRLVDHPKPFESAEVIRPVHVPEQCIGKWVQSLDTRSLGLAVVGLGGGRTYANQPIDHRVGCAEWLRPGQMAEAGNALAIVHAKSESDFEIAARRIQQAYTFSEQVPELQSSVVLERLTV